MFWRRGGGRRCGIGAVGGVFSRRLPWRGRRRRGETRHRRTRWREVHVRVTVVWGERVISFEPVHAVEAEEGSISSGGAAVRPARGRATRGAVLGGPLTRVRWGVSIGGRLACCGRCVVVASASGLRRSHKNVSISMPRGRGRRTGRRPGWNQSSCVHIAHDGQVRVRGGGVVRSIRNRSGWWFCLIWWVVLLVGHARVGGVVLGKPFAGPISGGRPCGRRRLGVRVVHALGGVAGSARWGGLGGAQALTGRRGSVAAASVAPRPSVFDGAARRGTVHGGRSGRRRHGA